MSATVVLLLFAVVSTPGSGAAQNSDPPIGDCDFPLDEAFLDVGNVRAKVLNHGRLFWNGGQHVYEAPKGSGIQSIFTSGFWLGGQVNDELRMSAVTYGALEMWAGPIPDDGGPPVDCARWDRIYELRIPYEAGSSGLSDDVQDWPVDVGAPYVERAGSPDAYEPDLGDHPRMLGDQMLWWIMNDTGDLHEVSDTPPLGAEVRTTAFAFADTRILGNTTFYRYRIRNRSRFDWRSMRVGLFFDPDVGNSFDDYMGSDSTLGLAYVYNGSNEDAEYGAAPPAIGLTAIRRPESTIDAGHPECRYPDGKNQGLTGNAPYIFRGQEPYTAGVLHHFLLGNRRNGDPMRIGEFPGVNTDPDADVTRFIYPGDPVAGEYWSEVNPGPAGNTQDDRRTVGHVGPFCLGPGDETEVVFAIVWARGESNLDSVERLRVAAAGIHEISEYILTPREWEVSADRPEPAPLAATLYPNPADGETRLRLGLPGPVTARIVVFDALGRRVHVVVDARLDAGDRTWTIDTSDWPSGVYLVRMQLDHLTETRRLVVTQ